MKKSLFKNGMLIAGYVVFCTFFLLIDFLTKQYALKTAVNTLVLNSYVTCELLINRGISWGLFHQAEQSILLVVSMSICLLILVLLGHTVMRCRKNRPIYGELLVISGALGNLIDRALYGGVIDFVILHLGRFCSPVFNIADAAIIVGAILMITTMYDEHN